MGVAQ